MSDARSSALSRAPVVAPPVLGAALVLASAVAFSLAGVLTKSISGGVWTVTCWRGLVGGLAIAAYVAARASRRGERAAFRLGWRGWLVASVMSLGALCFIGAFKNTYVANVAVIYAIAPFVAAMMEWGALGLRSSTATLAAAALSFLGVGVMVADGIGGGGLLGDALALAMMALCALYMVLVRAFRDTPVIAAGAASGLQLFVLGALVAQPFDVTAQDAWLLLAFGLSFALAVILWTEGTLLISAAESGLYGAAETPLAALFAWLLLAEAPPPAGLLGGALVMAAVLGKAAWEAWRAR